MLRDALVAVFRHRVTMGEPGSSWCNAQRLQHTVLPALSPSTALFSFQQCFAPFQAISADWLTTPIGDGRDTVRLRVRSVLDNPHAGIGGVIGRVDWIVEGDGERHGGAANWCSNFFRSVRVESRSRDIQILQRGCRFLRPAGDSVCLLRRQMARLRGRRGQTRVDGHGQLLVARTDTPVAAM